MLSGTFHCTDLQLGWCHNRIQHVNASQNSHDQTLTLLLVISSTYHISSTRLNPQALSEELLHRATRYILRSHSLYALGRPAVRYCSPNQPYATFKHQTNATRNLRKSDRCGSQLQHKTLHSTCRESPSRRHRETLDIGLHVCKSTRNDKLACPSSHFRHEVRSRIAPRRLPAS
jgi:hypothetical protein